MLTVQDIASAELDIIDTDGAATQFSKAAIIDFANRRTRLEVMFDMKLELKLFEDGVLKSASNFLGFNIRPQFSLVEVVTPTAVPYAATLDTADNPSSGRYQLEPGLLPLSFGVRVTLACDFTNPATVNNPAATESFTLVYFAALRSGLLNKRVLVLADDGVMAELDI